MTSKLAVIMALSLLVNGVHLVFDEYILKNKFLTSNLVFLLSACLILRRFDILPRYCWRKCPLICTLLEIPLTIITLEVSLYYIWRSLQEYIVFHSDDILVNLSDRTGLNWLVCQLCCGRHNCPDLFAGAVVKITSFAFLLSVCSFLKLSLFRDDYQHNILLQE